MLTPREVATILVALRYWQRLGHVRFFKVFLPRQLRPLSTTEIDDLCQRLGDSADLTTFGLHQ